MSKNYYLGCIESEKRDIARHRRDIDKLRDDNRDLMADKKRARERCKRSLSTTKDRGRKDSYRSTRDREIDRIDSRRLRNKEKVADLREKIKGCREDIQEYREKIRSLRKR